MSKNTGTSELINYFDLGVNGDVGIAGSLDINTIANATTDTDTFLVSDTGIIKYRTGAQLLLDIGAAPAVAGGYVPYFGGTSNVDLGIYNLTASAIIANGSGSNSGIVHLESNAIHSLVNGYGSIASGTTNQFNLYQTTGAGVFRGAILSLNSITEFATRTFTLPDADGTIALTSNIPANAVGGTGTTNYLPKFTGSTTIGNSNIQDNGSLVSVGVAANFSSSVTSLSLDVISASGVGSSAATGLARFITAGTSNGIAVGQSNSSRYTAILANEHIIYNDDFFMRTNGNFPLSIGTNNTTNLRVFSDGNVLIQTGGTFTNNGARLQVSGGATVSGALTSTELSVNKGASDTIGAGSYVFYSNVGGTRGAVHQLNAAFGLDTFTFDGSTWSRRMTVTNGGNVGIGTSTPNSGKLVVSDASSTKIVISGGTTQNGMTWESAGGAHSFYLFNGTIDSSGWGIYNVNTGGFPLFATNGGNVLIGTTLDNGYLLRTADKGTTSTNAYFGTGNVRIGGAADAGFNQVLSIAPGVVGVDAPGIGNGRFIVNGSGAVGINSPSPTAKFHAYGTTKLENYFYYGYAQSFVWQSSFNNPVQSLFTFNASAPYSQTLIKVTFIQNGVSNGYAARYVGYALAHLNPYSFNSSVTAMTAEYTNGPSAPTLSWSGQTLQITPQRITNYDGYVVILEWGSNTNTNASPTVTM